MIIPPGFCAVFARYTSNLPHPCQNVGGYELGAPLTQGDVDDISTALSIPYKAQLHNAPSSFDGIHVLEGQDGEPLAWDSSAGAGAGARTGDLSPPQVQGLIRKLTGLSGRHGRGRLFIPDILESQTDDSGGLNTTAMNLLQAIGNGWYQDVPVAVANVGNFVLLHNDSTPPTDVTGTLAEHLVATQRRRFPRS